jgi:hypothetical protein
MITDQDVVQLFGSFACVPLGLSEAEIKGKQNQIFRRGEGEHYPAGCTRHLALFSRLNVIPEYCFDCCKIIIAPRNVMELFKLLMIFDSDKFDLQIENTRKCMVEERDYCSGTYKGYIFCRGAEDGKATLELAKKVISEHISPEVNVELKRGCSEYAIKYPKFEQAVPGKKRGQHVMEYKKSWRTQEAFFDANFSIIEQKVELHANDQTSYSSAGGAVEYIGYDVFCMQYWLRYAATIGDESYLSITGEAIQPLPHLAHRQG